jgi:hypothetical protein
MAETKVSWPQLMNEALTAPGNLGSTYSRFHDYSVTNMMLFMMQGIHEPVASESRWKALGRTRRDGTRRKEVIVPVFAKAQELTPVETSDETEESTEAKKERIARLIGFTVVKGVLALSDTEGAELPPAPIPGWDLTAALGKLGIREVPFDNPNGNLQGWSHGVEFAINPIAVNRNKTIFHEIGHIVLGHTIPHRYEEYQAHRGIMEFQAEATAYLVVNELELMDEETASHSRGYIRAKLRKVEQASCGAGSDRPSLFTGYLPQLSALCCRHWLGEEQPPDQAIRQVFTAADRILRAGRTTPIATPTPAAAPEL